MWYYIHVIVCKLVRSLNSPEMKEAFEWVDEFGEGSKVVAADELQLSTSSKLPRTLPELLPASFVKVCSWESSRFCGILCCSLGRLFCSRFSCWLCCCAEEKSFAAAEAAAEMLELRAALWLEEVSIEEAATGGYTKWLTDWSTYNKDAPGGIEVYRHLKYFNTLPTIWSAIFGLSC